MKIMQRLLAALLVILPGMASACPVCFGADGSNKALGTAFNIAVTMTLGITMGLIASGIAWLRRIERRRMAQDALMIARLDVGQPEESGWPGSSPSPTH
jgi:hypothetical protein